FFQNNDARIVSNPPRQLSVADIDGVNFLRAALQQAIGEPAGRSANVERNFVGNIDTEMIECAFQFLSTATDIALRLRDGDVRFKIDKLRWLGRNFLAD